ncbi:MAG: NADPH-dependent oxidoreductase [Pseudobdellovibrio sp.]|jgi:nitroreductase|nr:NADPH-dependent oxidoreductase [Pseudobdellovibrio sp.]
MNNIYDLINSHSSVRKFQERDIPEDVLSRIVSAATRASTSGNMQCYSIIVTRSLELRKKLLKPHFNQSMVTEAPVLLTFCADFHRMKRWLEVSQAPQNFDNFMSFMIAAIDAVLASQNAALAAESEGLGLCYMGTTLASCNEIGKILSCPKNVVPVAGFALGYPAEKPQPRERLPLKAIIHEETYRSYSDTEISALYSEKETKGMQRYKSIPELRQKIEELQAKNLAQVYTKAKYTRESHLQYSTAVLDFLKQQNFLEFE